VLRDAPGDSPDLILIATGSEVHLALEAQEALAERGVQACVVSMPCWERFEAQSESYRNEVLPPEVTARLAIEAAAPLGWERYVGLEGAVMGIERFGASAPYRDLMKKFGFTAEVVAKRALEILESAYE
jgi:transketolase